MNLNEFFAHVWASASAWWIFWVLLGATVDWRLGFLVAAIFVAVHIP